MKNKLFDNDEEVAGYQVSFDDKYTFYGVLSEFYDEIFYRCKTDGSKKSYYNSYKQHILPYLGNRVLEQCEQADFEDVIQKLEKQHYRPKTVQRFRYLIRTVVRQAVKQGICKDVLFGSIFSISPEEKEEDAKTAEFVRNRKSLTIREEIRLFQEIMVNPEQEGDRMGLALMFALGMRNNEACGMKFGAIRPMESHPEHYCAWIYETTIGDTSRLKGSGKTKNAPRILPVPSKLLELLQKRRAFLQEMIDEGTIQLQEDKGQKTVDDLPIACQKFDYTEHCTSRHLTTAGRLILRAIKINEAEVAYIDRELQDEERMIEMGVTEKDPTAYLLRRNLGTHLYLLGLTEAEIQYFMGHDIEENNLIRNDFTNEERLYLIMRKMSNRPLFNDAYPHQEIMMLSDDTGPVQCSDVPAVQIEVESKRNSVLLFSVVTKEPRDEISVQIESKNQGKFEGIATVTPIQPQEDVSRTVNVISQYQKAYDSLAKKK